MKKRILSILLCLCMFVGLLPNGVLAVYDDALKVSYGNGGNVPAEYSGVVANLEPVSEYGSFDTTGWYALKIGLRNVTQMQSFTINVQLDGSKVDLWNPARNRAGTWDNAVVGAPYVSELTTVDWYNGKLVTDPSDGIFSRTTDTTAVSSGTTLKSIIAYDIHGTDDICLDIDGVEKSGQIYLFTSPKDTTIYVSTIYFKLKDTSTIAGDCVSFYGTTATDGTAASTLKGATVLDSGVCLLGFPAPPEEAVEATVKAVNSSSSNAPLSGLKVNISGESNGGVKVKDQNTGITPNDDDSISVTTGADGSVKVNLYPGTYTLTAPDQTISDTNYAMDTGAEGTGTLTVTKSGENTGTVSMHKVTTNYTVNVRAVDKSGTAVSLAGANLSFAGASQSITNDTLTFTVSTTGDKDLTLSGVTGMQNITSGKVTIGMATTSTANVARFSVVKGSDIARIVEDSGTTYIQLTLEPTVTMVKIPIPVPDKTTKEDAENLTATFTQGTEKISVDATVTETGDGTFSVTVDAPLPDGTYTMTIGGAGFDPVTKPVTVITGPDGKTIVNVGGTVTEADGTTTVTGGVTGVVDSTPNADGNNVVDLTGDDTNVTLKKDSEVTIDGTNTTETKPGQEVTGGLLGDETLKDELTPAVMSDPVYEVETQLTKLDNGAYDKLEATVYLKNAVAGAGTFGMWYDKELFELPTTGSVIALESGLDFMTVPGSVDAKLSQDSSDHYVYFYWYKTNSSGATEINALSERVPIAKITLKVKSTVSQSQLHNTMLQALTFTETEAGQSMLTTAGSDAGLRNNLLSPYWRQKDAAGADNFNTASKIDSAFADGDGFYQFAHTDTAGAADPDEVYVENYDIRIQFKLPKEVEKTSARFWVRENEDTGIENAEIIIYDGEGNPVLADPLKTDANGRVYAILDPGTYYYTITETSHWDYPTGQAVNPGFQKDCFELKADGSVEMKKLTLDSGDEWTTTTSVNTITPFMLPKTRHQVFLDDASNATPGTPMALDLTISSSTIAYNSVPYYFTLQPGAGWTWTETDMNEVAKKLSAKLYAADPEGADDTAKFRTKPGTLEAPETGNIIKWDPAKEQFYIASTIGGDAIGIDPDPLRAGDLLILVSDPTDLVEETQYEITATVGKGGNMTFAQPTDPSTLDTTNANESSSGSGTYVGLGILKETLAGGGTTSGTYTFTPRSGYSIDKVVINGVAQFLSAEDKATDKAYTYQFKDITGNQTIYVTFLDPNGNPASDASLTVTVGDHGGVTVEDDPAGTIMPAPTATPITGPDSATYTLLNPTENPLDRLDLTIAPATGYEIDKVLVNGTPKDVGTLPQVTAGDGTTTGDTKKLSLTGTELETMLKPTTDPKGAKTNSIVITFKPFGEESTQAIVTASVVKGMGAVSPAGITIYPLGATPTYTMTPGSADWLINTEAGSKAVMLYEDNVTPADTTGTDASDQVTGNYSYTLPGLTGDMRLEITFSEKTYTVSGLIQTIHTSGTEAEKIAAATLTFKRQGDGVIVTDTSDDMATAGANAKLSFDVEVPKGTWDVTISKQGYLNHTITGFEVDGTNTTIQFGLKTAGGSDRYPVALIPGDAAGDGLAVAVNDASTVVAGWLTGATKRNRVKGDIDESEFASSGSSGSADMTRVSNNLGKIRKSQTYADFCASGSNTGMPTT